MVRKFLQRMSDSAYVARLAKTFPIFAFILLLQAILCVHLLWAASAVQMGVRVFLHFFFVATFRSLFWASLAWALVAWVKSEGRRRFVATIVVVLFSILHLFESYLLGKYGEGYTFSVVTVLMATTPAESHEYLTTVFSPMDLLRGVLEVGVALLLTLWLMKRLCSRFCSKGKHLMSILLIVIGVANICNLAIFMPRVYEYTQTSGAPIDALLSPVDRVIWNTGLAYGEINKIEARIHEIEQIDLGKLESSHPYGQINVVVIIGESLRRDYMHCYGYPLENTPKLDSLIADGSVVAYSDVISPATMTAESLTKVLTYLSLGSKGGWYDYPALPNVLSRSGYDTYWMSNQEVTGTYVQPINTIARMSQAVRYLKMKTGNADYNPIEAKGLDMEVLPYLRKSDPRSSKSFVQFVHLMGSHFAYERRYPKSYARFSSRDIKAKGDKVQIADYVNSVYYNDDVVASIVKHYQDEKTLLFYFSDHGETLFDGIGGDGGRGHGRSERSNVEIPFMVYVSPKLRAEFPELYDRIVRCKDRPIVNDLFTNSLLALLGIKSKYSNEKLEYFSDGYDTSRPRRPVTMNRSFSYEK